MSRLFIVLVTLAIGIILLIVVKPIFYDSNACYYSGVVGSVLAAFFAAFLVWVAWEELGKISKTSSADFIHRVDNDFFTHETRILVSLIDCGALEFNDKAESSDDIEVRPYFEINQDKLKKSKLPEEVIQRLSEKKYYSTWEIDDLLLGHFENIGMLEQKRVVNFQMVYDVFSWYLETIWKDDHIKKYITYCRNGEKASRIDTVFYNQFQYIVTKCLEYDALHSGLCLWWWKFKRRFRGPKIEIEI